MNKKNIFFVFIITMILFLFIKQVSSDVFNFKINKHYHLNSEKFKLVKNYLK